MKVLVLGASGMLGFAVYNRFSSDPKFETWGTLRNSKNLQYFQASQFSRIICDVNVLSQDDLVSVLSKVRPEIVINCVGLIKQYSHAGSPLVALPINSIFPHRLLSLCDLLGARLIHISTDCVFSGRKGMYVETDTSDAEDIYGKSKYIGELHGARNAITLRTSIVGHELGSALSLVDWFLSQKNSVNGYANAIFSGLPTVELADVIKDYVLPRVDLHGLYHVSADPIDKLSLLKIISSVYGHSIDIKRDESVCVDRSLDSSLFRREVGYTPPGWEDLIKKMYDYR